MAVERQQRRAWFRCGLGGARREGRGHTVDDGDGPRWRERDRGARDCDGRAAGGERLGADDEAASAVCGDGLPCDDEGHCCDLALGGGARAEEHGAAAYYDLGLAIGGLNDDGCALDADGLASGHGLCAD